MTDVRLSVRFCAAHTHGVNTASRTRRSKSNEVETSNRVIENAHEHYPMRQASTRGTAAAWPRNRASPHTETELGCFGTGSSVLRPLRPHTRVAASTAEQTSCSLSWLRGELGR